MLVRNYINPYTDVIIAPLEERKQKKVAVTVREIQYLTTLYQYKDKMER